MEIPTAFRLGRRRFTVHMMSAARPERAAQGYLYTALGMLKLRKQPPKKQAHTFWHEVVHAILHDMGDARWADEAFVDGVAKRINQVVHTAEFK